MNDGFTWWLIVVGIAIGVGIMWVFLVRLPRAESDVDSSELPLEADWISRNIESYGGIAPQPLVEEVLELHRQYLVTGQTPLPTTWRPSASSPEPEPEPETETQAAAVAVPEPAPTVTSEVEPLATGQPAYARPAEPGTEPHPGPPTDPEPEAEPEPEPEPEPN